MAGEQDAGRLVAIVVTHNRLGELKQTLARLLAADRAHLAAVMVFDNASDDGTAAWLAAHPEGRQAGARLVVETSPENLGGAGGFEAAMRRAVGRFDPDWLLLMDDDGRPEPGCLAAFHRGARHRAEAWFAAVRNRQGEICDMNRPWLNPFWHKRAFLTSLGRGREGFHLGSADFAAAAPRPVDGGSFVGLFLSRRAVELAGYPDGALFIYGDDVLYTLGLRAAGGRAMFDPSLRFEHACTNAPGGGGVLAPLWKVYFYHRNLTMVYRKTAGPVFFWPVLAMKWVLWRRRARLYGADRARYLRLLRRAVRDGLRQDTAAGLAEVERM
ncbi:MAG TPA: glycosyltransferase [Rhodobacteraceae bacterium]|nr:glycosyltransferase [Paracoccaceae bacterium]